MSFVTKIFLLISLILLGCYLYFSSQSPARSIKGNVIQIYKASSPQMLTQNSNSFYFEGLDSHIALNYFQLTAIKSLELQANLDNIYLIQGSQDGKNWQTLCYIPKINHSHNNGIRKINLTSPFMLRYIAISPVGGNDKYMIHDFRAFVDYMPIDFKELLSFNKIIYLGLALAPLLVIILLSLWVYHQQPLSFRSWILIGISLLLLSYWGWSSQSEVIYHRVYRYIIRISILLFSLIILLNFDRVTDKKGQTCNKPS